jgi:hypothetical protein
MKASTGHTFLDERVGVDDAEGKRGPKADFPPRPPQRLSSWRASGLRPPSRTPAPALCEWGPIIGDCVHNAASALDQLAYQLATLRLQPYHGMDGPADHWLMILKRLSNSDKHRMLRTVGYRFGGTAHYRPDSLIDAIFPTGPLKLGAELARFVFDPPDPEMNVDPSFIVHIAFKDTPMADGIDTWAMLNTICIRLEAVVDEFRPLFR